MKRFVVSLLVVSFSGKFSKKQILIFEMVEKKICQTNNVEMTNLT
jgi:hypothetical protein